LPVGCEAVTRGLKVFEGIKGYWDVNGNLKGSNNNDAITKT
jgi:hypothetical protein